MVIIRNWKKYYTMEEAKLRSDKRIEENARKFAKRVIEWQKENNLVKEKQYL